MSFFRTILTLAVMAALAGCGFHPLYGGSENAAINSQLGAIQIVTIEIAWAKCQFAARPAQSTRPAAEPALHVEFDRTGQQSGNWAKIHRGRNRAKLSLSANYFLTDNQSGAILTEGTRSLTVIIYPILFARVAAENDATDRAAREISDELGPD